MGALSGPARPPRRGRSSVRNIGLGLNISLQTKKLIGEGIRTL